MSASTAGIPESTHLDFQELAEGVWAALAIDGGYARSNGGFVDLGDLTIAIDTHMSPRVAFEVKSAAEAITVRPVDYVFYTHWHHDHVFGGQAYGAETRVIASAATYQLMSASIHETYANSLAGMRQQVDQLQQTILTQSDANQRGVHQHELDMLQDLVESLSDFQPRLPQITFSERIELHGTKRSAILLCLGGGHSPNDSVLYLPDDGILFGGDLLFNGRHPFMGGGGDPHEWIRILLRIETECEPTTIVPGHGPLGTLDDLILERQYLSELERLVRQGLNAGQSLDELQLLDLPDEYVAWPPAPMLPRNIEFLYNRLSR